MSTLLLRSVALLALFAAACTSAPIAPPEVSGSPTGGLDMALWYARIDTRQYQYFVLSADGNLKYGGGLVAFDRKTEWSGTLTAEQGKQVRAIVDAAGWMTAKDPSRETEASPVAELTLANGKEERRFTIRGPDEAVIQVTDLLTAIADQRFERIMRALPEAGTRVK